MGISRRTNNIKLIRKVVPQHSVSEIVNIWNTLLDVPSLVDVQFNSKSMYDTNILQKEDGTLYSFDEALEALNKYIGVETTPLSLPNIAPLDENNDVLLGAAIIANNLTFLEFNFLRDILFNSDFEYYYNIKKDVVGSSLVAGKISARHSPFKGNSANIEKAINNGLLEKIMEDNKIFYTLTPLGRTLSFFLKNYTAYNPGNSPEFDKKINDEFTELLQEKTYDSYDFMGKTNNSGQCSMSEQVYHLSTDTGPTILFSHTFFAQNFYYQNHSDPSNFEETTRGFDLIVTTDFTSKKLNQEYVEQINEVIEKAKAHNNNSDLARLYRPDNSNKKEIYQKIIMEKVLEVQQSTRIPLEPVALIEAMDWRNGTNSTITQGHLIYRSCEGGSSPAVYHKICFKELKKFLLANNINYSDLELSVLPSQRDKWGYHIPLTLVMTNKETGKLVGMSNRIMKDYFLDVDAGNYDYVKYDIYHSLTK